MKLQTKLKLINPIKKTFIGHIIRFARGLKTYKHELVQKRIAEKDAQERRKDIRRMLVFCYKNFFTPYEYYLLGLDKKTDEESLTYISDCMKDDYCFRLNNPENKIIFDDKFAAYQRFRKYYKREIVRYSPVNTKQEDEELSVFIQKHRRFIIKPSNSGRGKGIEITEYSGNEEIQQFEANIKAKYNQGFVAEELITQSTEIAVFHPDSLNTIRMPTMKIGNEVMIFHPFFRTGRGNSVIDNASTGGIASLIDVETGCILAAIDKKGNTFTVHPDSGIPLIGFKMPKWKEAIELAKQLAMEIPGSNYTAWDIALTDSGWVMVEGNAHGQFASQQVLLGHGLKPEVDEICRRLGV